MFFIDKIGDKSKKKASSTSTASSKNKSLSTTIIGKGFSVEGGTITGDGDVRIDGYFVGDINIKGHVEINNSGAVYGEIDATSICINGNCKGNTITGELINLASNAVVECKLKARSIVIDEGAVFNGVCEMESHVQLPSKEDVLPSPPVVNTNKSKKVKEPIT